MSNDNFWNDERVKELLRTVTSYKDIDHWGKIISEYKSSHTTKEEEVGWEIVEFKIDYAGYNNVIFKQSTTHKKWYVPQVPFDSSFSYQQNEATLLNQKAAINSILRKSDGQTFTVGQMVHSTWGQQVITDFIFSDNKKIDDLIVQFPTCRNPLEKIQPLPKRTKLFTTTDGKDLYDGDEFFFIFSDKTIGRGIARSTNDWTTDKNLYSTKEAAMCSIPCLSVNDVLEISKDNYVFLQLTSGRLKELAKSKLH